jgi:hypothetical protein
VSAKNPADSAPSATPSGGYRTLVPGQGEVPAQGVTGQATGAKPKSAATPAAPTEPAAKPQAAKPESAKPANPDSEKPHADPTRFGDWEVKGRCIDF